jgi:hypothetical protein
MIKKIKIELIYFCVILLILAVLQHSDLLHSPMQRANLMAEKENYLHPLLWTSVVYVVVGFFRLIVKLFKKIRG